MKIDVEMKIVLLLGLFALLKFFKIHEWSIARECALSLFGVIHVFLVLIFLRSSTAINSERIKTEQRFEAKQELKDHFRGAGIRAIIVLMIHFQTKLIPPLIVSSVFSILSLLENKWSFKQLKELLSKSKQD